MTNGNPRLLGVRRSVRRHLLLGVAAVAFLVVGVGGWAATAELSGAIIAQGQLAVETSVKKVQHPTGGVVGELRVRDGDRVKTGDVLLRLDETVTRANLSIVTKNLDELAARQARNEAERDGEDAVAFPPDLAARGETDAEVRRLLSGETRLFQTRRASRDGQRAQLRERVAQLRQQIEGLTQQTHAKGTEIELIGPELEGVRELWRKNLIQITRVNALQRDAARLEGERGQLTAATAEAKGKIVETELQILQIDQDMRSDVGRELAEIRGKMSEFVERKVSAEDQLKRIDIRAPQDGVVHQLTVHTVGGVITPGAEPIMLVVPAADDLRVEAKIQPHDVDQVRVGQSAILRFPSFNQRTTPELTGEVSLVAADVVQDQRTASAFYTIYVKIPREELKRLGDLRLIPGMPVEAFVQTSPRTVMSYLVKPLSDQVTRAFRER